MADPEETRRYDEIMARNGVSRQDYADPRYQDYLRAQGQGTGDSKRDIEEFGRYKQTGQTQSRLPPPVNSSQPMPGQDGIPQDAVFRGMPGTYAMPPQVQTQMTDMFGNPTTPDQYFPQQDAFVAQLIERLGQNQSGTYLGQGAPPADWGRPQPFDINNLWGNAGDMIQGGWRNPFAAPMEANPYLPTIRDPGNPTGPEYRPDVPPLTREQFDRRRNRMTDDYQAIDAYGSYEDYVMYPLQRGRPSRTQLTPGPRPYTWLNPDVPGGLIDRSWMYDKNGNQIADFAR
jgi:hypothetical protein